MSLESDAMPFTIGFRHEQLDGGSDDFVFSITKDGLRSQIPENDSTVLIGKDDRVARRLNDRPKAKFGSPQSVSLTLQFFERASAIAYRIERSSSGGVSWSLRRKSAAPSCMASTARR